MQDQEPSGKLGPAAERQSLLHRALLDIVQRLPPLSTSPLTLPLPHT